MFLTKPRRKRNRSRLMGAVQINNTSFFVCKNNEGQICLRTGKEENLQKAMLQKMIDLNPSIKKILHDYKIKPNIDTKTLKELAGGHMNETCKIAIGIHSMLSENLKSKISKNIIKEASMLQLGVPFCQLR